MPQQDKRATWGKRIAYVSFDASISH
jgi:hypothetical protein